MTISNVPRKVNLKGTVMRTENPLINDRFRYQKYNENFAFQLFIILQ